MGLVVLLAACSGQQAQKAAQGDMAAFEALYQRHNRRVYSLCLRMTQNISEAEDLAQEVFIQLFRKIDRLLDRFLGLDRQTEDERAVDDHAGLMAGLRERTHLIGRYAFLDALERFVVAEDCGKLVNPLIVDGQVHGGVAQGIGAALYEEIVYDDEGQIHTASLVDYLVPAANEIPPMQVVHLETESPTTLGGFRGMGEGGTIGAPAAVANAIADALSPLGIEIDELPVTPERLFRLIRAAKAKA